MPMTTKMTRMFAMPLTVEAVRVAAMSSHLRRPKRLEGDDRKVARVVCFPGRLLDDEACLSYLRGGSPRTV